MTKSVVVYSDLSDSREAGTALGSQIAAQFPGRTVDAVILFASSSYSYTETLSALQDACQPKCLVGCSSAGEFITGRQGESSACAIAILSDDMHFASSLGHGLRTDRAAAARQLALPFARTDRKPAHPHRYILLLTDALAGHTDDFIEQINLATGGSYEIFGGGAGDDAKFRTTHVFHGVEAVTDAAVALEILSSKPLGIGVGHGWLPTGKPMRVTEAKGMTLVSLDAIVAAEWFEEYAKEQKQSFDRSNPIPFFLHNVLGIQTPEGYKLRVPLSVNSDGSILCASDIPEGAIVSMMKASVSSSVRAAENAVESALKGLKGNRPQAALFFDCVATRLRLGDSFGLELKTLQESLGASVKVAGCNSYGQVARSQGQFSGFHNCTAVVCIIPE